MKEEAYHRGECGHGRAQGEVARLYEPPLNGWSRLCAALCPLWLCGESGRGQDVVWPMPLSCSEAGRAGH